MKQIITNILIILTLVSCTQYEANVRIEKCNGDIDTVHILYTNRLYIKTHKEAVPILCDGSNGRKIILNVCDYIVLSEQKVD